MMFRYILVFNDILYWCLSFNNIVYSCINWAKHNKVSLDTNVLLRFLYYTCII